MSVSREFDNIAAGGVLRKQSRATRGNLLQRILDVEKEKGPSAEEPVNERAEQLRLAALRSEPYIKDLQAKVAAFKAREARNGDAGDGDADNAGTAAAVVASSSSSSSSTTRLVTQSEARDVPKPQFDIKKQDRFVQLFDYEIVQDKFTFTCSLPCSSHEPRFSVAAVQSSGQKIIPKRHNLTSHLANNHNAPWAADKWRDTALATDDKATSEIISTAVSLFSRRCCFFLLMFLTLCCCIFRQPRRGLWHNFNNS